MKMLEKLKTLQRTLNEVSVQGQSNIYFMLGAMQLLEEMITQQSSEGADQDG